MRRIDPSEQIGGFDWHPDPAHAKASTDVDYQRGDRRVKVKVMVRVDMIERQACCLERGKLCFDFGGELGPRSTSQRDVDSSHGEAGAEPPVAVDEIRDALGRQRREPVDQHEVQTDSQVRQSPRARDGVGSGRAADHEAGRGENAFGVSPLDAFVDFRH